MKHGAKGFQLDLNNPSGSNEPFKVGRRSCFSANRVIFVYEIKKSFFSAHPLVLQMKYDLLRIV